MLKIDAVVQKNDGLRICIVVCIVTWFLMLKIIFLSNIERKWNIRSLAQGGEWITVLLEKRKKQVVDY